MNNILIEYMSKNKRNKLLKELADYLKYQDEQILEYKDKLENYNKDKEIQKLQNEIREIKRKSLRILSDKELKDIEEFNHKHYNSCKSGTRLILEGSEIGTGIDIQCRICNEKKDITDYDIW